MLSCYLNDSQWWYDESVSLTSVKIGTAACGHGRNLVIVDYLSVPWTDGGYATG